MQTKLKTVVTVIVGLMIFGTTNIYADSSYCGDNIVPRALAPYSVGKQYLAQLCNTYDKCNDSNSIGDSRCDRQFFSSITRKCNSLYDTKTTKLDMCIFSAKTYNKLLTRYANPKKNTENSVAQLKPRK